MNLNEKEKLEEEEVRQREKSRQCDKERRSQAFVPVEELPDPDFLSIEEAILEKIDEER